MKKIVSDFLKGFKKIGEETGKELVIETTKIGETIITGKELLGDIKPLSEQDMAKARAVEERKKQEEMANLRTQMSGGRNVEREVEGVRKEKERQQKEEEERMLEEVRRKREMERQEAAQMEAAYGGTNSHKGKKKRGSAFMPGKKQGATEASQSATAEYFKKPD